MLTHSASCYGEDADRRDCLATVSIVICEARAFRRDGRTEERKNYDEDEGDDTHVAGLLCRNVLGKVDSKSIFNAFTCFGRVKEMLKLCRCYQRSVGTRQRKQTPPTMASTKFI